MATTVLVQRISITGNTAFTDKTLHTLIAHIEQTSQNLNGLLAATERITQYYQQHGYTLARAYLPPQDVSDGVVYIRVQEARYGDIEITNASRVRDGILQASIARLRPNDPIRKQALERSLLLLNELAGVDIKALLRAGRHAGATDLSIQARPTPLLSGNVDADNHGGANTGRYRLGAGVEIASPLRLGDALSIRLLSSDAKQRYHRVSYGIPINAIGTRLQLDTSTMRYQLGGPFSVLEANGRADIRSASLRHALFRGNRAALDVALSHERKSLHDNMDLFGLRARKRIALWSASISLNSEDALLGGGRTAAQLSHARGELALLDPDSQLTDAAYTHSAGWFGRTNLNLNRLQRTGNRSHLVLRGSAQWASRNLDGAEKFGLGGPYAVRAYALDLASGDQGWQANVEWRLQPAPRWQLGSFIDTGRVRTNRSPWNDESNHLRLTAAGLRLSHASTSHTISATAAWPISAWSTANQPRKPRLWLHASRFF